MTARRTRTITGAIAASTILAACSNASVPTASSTTGTASQPTSAASEPNPPGDIPDNQAYVAFSPAGGGYSVKIPEGWARASEGSTTSFSEKLNRIQVSTAAATTEPTVTSVTNTELPSIRSHVSKFALGAVSVVNLSGGKAVVLTYRVDSPPDQVTGRVVRDAVERYSFYRAGRRVDLTLTAPINADNVDPWRRVSNSLRWN